MAILTLTTDFGEKDHFVGAIKGAIYSEFEDITIVDISHKISQFNILEAGYIIQNAYKSFPKGSIHIIGIDTELTPENKHIAALIDGHYFVCSNNGVLSHIINKVKADKIVEITVHDNINSNFPTLDIFVPIACHIARGGTLEVIGKPIEEISTKKHLIPFTNENKTEIIGTILYVDHFGNVVTNISKAYFDNISQSREFTLEIRQIKIKRFVKNYNDILDTNNHPTSNYKELMLFNSSNYLEIAMYKSTTDKCKGASDLMGVKPGQSFVITFK